MTDQQRMVGAMTRMAMFRQAEVSRETYVAYALALTEQEITADEVETVCRSLESRPRVEGETAFPSLGTILTECRRLARGGWGAWRDECAVLHDNRCTNVTFHEAVKDRDRA